MRLQSFLVIGLVCIQVPFTKVFTVVLLEPYVLSRGADVDCCIGVGLFPFVINLLHPVVVNLTEKYDLCGDHNLCVRYLCYPDGSCPALVYLKSLEANFGTILSWYILLGQHDCKVLHVLYIGS